MMGMEGASATLVRLTSSPFFTSDVWVVVVNPRFGGGGVGGGCWQPQPSLYLLAPHLLPCSMLMMMLRSQCVVTVPFYLPVYSPSFSDK